MNDFFKKHPELYVPLTPNLQPSLNDISEIPVYSLAAIDDINLHIPDALFNGEATVRVIQNCVPIIKNAWLLNDLQIQYFIISIQLATKGEGYDVSSVCPKCKEENTYAVDLQNLLRNMASITAPDKIVIKDIEVQYTLPNFKISTEYSIRQFTHQKYTYQLSNKEPLVENEQLYTNLVNEANELNLLLVLNHIKQINYHDNSITEKTIINEFIRNCDRSMFNEIKKQITDFYNKLYPLIDLNCGSCEYKFKTLLNLEYGINFRNNMIEKTEKEIRDMTKEFERTILAIKKDLLHSVWFMRGGVSYSEILNMAVKERELIAKIVESNLKTTKESKLPFF